MSGQRGSNGFGPTALAFVEIEAWQRLVGVRLRPWERRAILAMDAVYRTTCAEATKEDEDGGEPLTPDLLKKIAGG